MEAIRPAIQDDLQAVFELNLASFAESWSFQSLTEALKQGYDLNVWFTAGGKLAAYYLGRDVLDEVHIMQVAVVPDLRRQGLASRLIRRVLEAKRKAGMRYAWLEVRASNIAAQRLYASLGFRVSDRRKAYYTPHSTGDSREDALVMCFDF